MFTLIGAVSNAIRGGQLGIKSNHDLYNALITVFCTALSMCNPLSPIQGISMWLGAIPGWGAYIGALGKEHADISKLSEIWIIDCCIHKYCTLETQQQWGFYGLTLRGLYWGLCLAILPACLNYWITSIAFILVGVSMGLAYRTVIQWCNALTIEGGTISLSRAWALSEWAFGAVLFLPLDIMVLERILLH